MDGVSRLNRDRTFVIIIDGRVSFVVARLIDVIMHDKLDEDFEDERYIAACRPSTLVVVLSESWYIAFITMVIIFVSSWDENHY